MKLLNKRSLIWLVVACLTTGIFSTSLLADPQMNPEDRKQMMEVRAHKAQLETKERMLKLKTALTLRPEQMTAWDSYESFMLNSQKQHHAKRKEMHQKRKAAGKPPTSLELAEQNVKRLEDRLSNAKERLVVFSNLYNSLDEQQKQTIDKLAHRKIKHMAREHRQRQTDK